MVPLVANLKNQYPAINFIAGRRFYWSPEKKEVFYIKNSESSTAVLSLLHETSHALLDHSSYRADFELLRLELAAWEKARILAVKLSIIVDEEYIQDCLDTYRDWLYKRSICPHCRTKCLQQSDYIHYRCFNCHTIWKVTPSRFCRSYRTTKNNYPKVSIFELHSEVLK